MFGKKDSGKLPGPKEIPEIVGRSLVVNERKDPDAAWKLKGVCHPGDKKNIVYCRVFDEKQALEAGVKVKDWTSLDEHRDLIIWEGYFDKNTNEAHRETYSGAS